MLTGNIIKIIACIAMLIDHIGLFLFPDVIVLRCIGRISMPLFAFFIAEGCRYTSNRLRYFLNVFVLAVICQSVYFVQMMIKGVPKEIYLNILFTFSISILLCFSYLDLRLALSERKTKGSVTLSAMIFGITLLTSALVFYVPANLFDVKVHLEYGFLGALLPLFAVIFNSKPAKLLLFSFGVGIFVLERIFRSWITGFALLAIPILFLYNGKRGTRRLKYLFYIFYPLNIGGIYLLSAIIK